MFFTNRVKTFTQDKIVPKVTDNFLGESLFGYRLVSNGKTWSGVDLKLPFLKGINNQGGSFSGMDTFSTNQIDVTDYFTYDVRFYEMPVVVAGVEKLINGISETQVINLVSAQMEISKMSLVDQISTMLYLDGSGNGGKDFNGLDNLVDDGTVSDLVGLQSRSSNPILKSVRTASGGSLTTLKVSTLLSSASAGSNVSQKPTLLVSDETVYDLFESLLSPQLRANYDSMGAVPLPRNMKAPLRNDQLTARSGFSCIIHKGTPVVADEKAPAQTLWALNENYNPWYGVPNADGMKKVTLSPNIVDGPYSDQPNGEFGMYWKDFVTPDNQYADIGHFFLFGNMVTNQPRRSGRLTGILTA